MIDALYSQKKGSIKNPPQWWQKVKPLGWLSIFGIPITILILAVWTWINPLF